jgi:2-oxoglutarate ferredoxin oxidoreductase subunit alpha
MKIKIRTGNQMIAEGALFSGCEFFAGYPITPASGIYKEMIEHLPKHNGVAISAPDEISALAYCVGASARGAKAMTATSGPGWALMIETLQYALMTEIPVVIAFVQRLGPSTGGATQGAQGDVLLAEFCTSGAYTIPIFTPSNPNECFGLTTSAFYWAETLRSPVIILSDKEVGMTSEDVDYDSLHSFPSISRNENSNNSSNLTYNFTSPEEVPAFLSVGGNKKVTVTGSAHDKKGSLQKNSPETLEVLEHLQLKITKRADEIAMINLDNDPLAEILIISFGITARTAKEAVKIARKQGKKVVLANILSLFPVPEKKLKDISENVHTIIIAEENITGQYRSVIQKFFPGKNVIGVNSIGRMIIPQQILNAIEINYRSSN